MGTLKPASIKEVGKNLLKGNGNESPERKEENRERAVGVHCQKGEDMERTQGMWQFEGHR